MKYIPFFFYTEQCFQIRWWLLVEWNVTYNQFLGNVLLVFSNFFQNGEGKVNKRKSVENYFQFGLQAAHWLRKKWYWDSDPPCGSYKARKSCLDHRYISGIILLLQLRMLLTNFCLSVWTMSTLTISTTIQCLTQQQLLSLNLWKVTLPCSRMRLISGSAEPSITARSPRYAMQPQNAYYNALQTLDSFL